MRAILARSIHPQNVLSGLDIATIDEHDAEQRHVYHLDHTFGEHSARIRIAANTVNHHDIWALGGVGLSEQQLPMILGTDGAGVLQDAGSAVEGAKPGDEVVLYSVFGANTPGMQAAGVAAGERRTLASEHYAGFMREIVEVPTMYVCPKPRNLTIVEAAALGTGWLTAYTMLFSGARVKPGDSVLIQGAGGSVATAAIQMAHAAGLEVIVASRDEARRTRARELGADIAVVSGARLPHKVDAVLDSVGAATWGHSLRSVRPGGTVVTCGATTGDQPGAELTRVFFQDIRIQGVTMGSLQDFKRMLRFVEIADLHPLIDSVYSVEQAAEAFRKVADGSMFGNVAISWE